MPKRKWSNYQNDGGRSFPSRKDVVSETLTQSKKLLHRALKTAKGFERQKLGKRQKIAIDGENFEDVRRINREIEALKGLNLDKTTHAHLQKSLLKVKAIAESELLPEDMKVEIEKPHMGEEERKALHNVTSGLYNMKPVKETMGKIVKEMYSVLGIAASAPGKGNKDPLKGILKGGTAAVSPKVADEAGKNGPKGEKKAEPTWEGFDSEPQTLEENSDIEDSDDDENVSVGSEEELDEETISGYDALLGVSSDEESFDEEIYKANRSSPPSNRLSLSLSPSPSHSPADPQSHIRSMSLSPPPQKASKPAKAKQPKEAPKASTFLPTLMGGYWSGSESSASDIEDDDPAPVRKNRPGQMARRAIYEKKFGERANHIKSGQGSVSQRKDDGWDPKRGAKDSNSRGRGGFAHGGGRGGRQRDFSKVTGKNATPVGEGKRERGAGKKDDVGVLHPSWQAAKKAKTEQKKATFTGKKVVFD
jgi:hypothetical protein